MKTGGRPATFPNGSAHGEASGEALVPVDVVLARGLALAKPPQSVRHVSLLRARGRILARPVAAPRAMPAFDNSAMDGYAVRTGDLDGPPPYALPLAGRVAAGDGWAEADRAPRGSAVRILTGAPVPPSFDAVIIQERVRVEARRVILSDRPRPGQNIRRAGEDADAGAMLMDAGQGVGARQLALLAAIGRTSAPVYSRLRVAMFSTGSELRQPGENLAPGQIYNSNRYVLAGLLDRPWIRIIDFGAVPDDPSELASTLRRAVTEADVVVSTGGVSVGEEDHMPRILSELGGDVHAMKIAIKPGKPLMLGRLGGALYLGLPGNPVAVFVTMAVIGGPILARCAGLEVGLPVPLAATAGFNHRSSRDRREYLPARVIGVDAEGLPLIEALPKANSGRVAQLVSAEGFAVIDPDVAEVSPGMRIAWLPMERLTIA